MAKFLFERWDLDQKGLSKVTGTSTGGPKLLEIDKPLLET